MNSETTSSSTIKPYLWIQVMLSILKSFTLKILQIGKRMMARVYGYVSRHPRMANGNVCGSKVFSKDINVEEEPKNLHKSNRRAALVVDSNNVTRLVHMRLLSSFGIDNQAVENGQEAINLYRNGAYFNLILMDNAMPVMNGPEATRTLRAMGVRSMIVGVTSQDREQERLEFIEAGLDDFQEKPLTHAKLTSILQELNSRFSE